MAPRVSDLSVAPVDLARRFGGVSRALGADAAQRIAQAHVLVVGVGGVGSWAAEALARCGVGALSLMDFDQIAESNVNRQIHALSETVGAAKVDVMAARVRSIHPGCAVRAIEAFADAESWPVDWAALGAKAPDVVLDACDDFRAKLMLAQWAKGAKTPLICVGAAGGKRKPQLVEVGDLSEATHDPLLAKLRYQLRRNARTDSAPSKPAAKPPKLGLTCVFSREAVAPPQVDACAIDANTTADSSLNCHGYGSLVTVTATFGMVAAQAALDALR
jgi:tRNA threonylcarbamoyladenosine dehydratase